MKVGFVGLGNIGSDIAKKLVVPGNDICVYDVVPAAVKTFESLGAIAADSAADVARWSDIVGICVRNDEEVREVLQGANGVLSGAAAGLLVAVHSTIRVDTVKALARVAAQNGVRVLDAPVSRITNDANKGIVFMVGGAPADVRALRPYLDLCAAKIVEAGPLGAAMFLKICNNMLTYINLIAADEAMNFAAAAGLDTAILAEVTSANGIGSPLFQSILLSGSATQGMPTSASELERVGNISEKDLDCALDLARSLGVELPAAAMARRQIRRALASRHNS